MSTSRIFHTCAALRLGKMSEKPSKEVILCRGSTGTNDTHDWYEKTFQAAGYFCKLLPVLRFEFSNLKSLEDCLLSPNSYGGLILTSQRAIEAIVLALRDRQLPNEWKDLPVFCVGPATASFAKATLDARVLLSSDRGNSDDLANCVVKEAKLDRKPLLYPCSSIARDTIERILNREGIKFQKICVYDTLPSETLENDLMQIFVNRSARIFVFFSPSAVEYTLLAARKLPRIVENILAVAIGPATAEALTKAEIVVRTISDKPEPDSLLKAIQEAELL